MTYQSPKPHLQTGRHTRGYLPHLKRDGATYFITFRLHDALPIQIIKQLQWHRKQSKHNAPEANHPEIDLDYHRKVELELDQSHGECWLRQPTIAELVSNSLKHFEGERYELHSWVIMPNHLHAVVKPLAGFLLGGITKSWKGYTAREANRILKRTGEPFWQRESFDHLIRNDGSFRKIERYVIENPVKAGLCGKAQDWRWSSAFEK